MGITKTMESPNTGADVEFHHVAAVTIDRDQKLSMVSVKSYVNKDKFSAGKNYTDYTQLTIPRLPPIDGDVFAWAEQEIATGDGSVFLGAVAE